MAHRDFNIIESHRAAPTFSIAGAEFKCLTEPPAGVLADLIISADGNVSRKAAAIIALIGGCMPEPQAEEFTTLIYSKDTVVPLESLAEIAEWLIEEYSRPLPTMPSSGSPAGLSTTPVTSEGGADSAGSTTPDSGSGISSTSVTP